MPWNTTLFDASGKIKDASAGQAWSYPGIPYATENVPSAIMPTVPTGANLASFPYDPCTLLPPAHPGNWPSAEQTDYYYIDKYHGSSTDTANSFGYPDKPRATIPSGASGSSAAYVEIHGNNGGYLDSSPDYDIGVVTLSMVGSSSQPIFWKGIDVPWLGQGFDVTGQHIILDGISLQNNDSDPLTPHISVDAGTEYFTYRNGEVRGTGGGITSGQGQLITIGGSSGSIVKFVMFYNNIIRDGGEWDVQHNKDIHAIRPLYWNRYIWIIDNTIFHVQGDLIQIGNSSNGSSDEAQRSHYIYIAGNEMYEAFENALDCKTSYHVIFSSNDVHDFGTFGPGTAIIASNNNEGELTAYHWIINNEVQEAIGGGIRHSGDRTGQKTYSIGNWVHDCDEGIRIGNHSIVGDNDEWIIHNTVTDCSDIAMTMGPTNGDELYIRGNITYDAPNDHIEDNNGFTTSTLTHHISYNSDVSATGVNEADYDTANNNDIDVDPVFTNPGVKDFTLQSGSPAVDAMTTRDAIFDDFQTLYGVSIATDIAGNPIPATNADIGAYQRV